MVDPSHGSGVTDSGFSAIVLHLDVADVTPAAIDLTATFDRGSRLVDLREAIRISRP